MIYDIFYVSRSTVDSNDWSQFHSRFPSSQKIENVKTFDDIKKKAFTKFFWVVWNDLTITSEFDFSYRVPKWDEEYIHVWKNAEYFDGVCLFSKGNSFSQREFDTRFFVNNKKEMDEVASHPRAFEIVTIDTYDEYLETIESIKTNMFWIVWNDLMPLDSFKFDFQVPFYNQHIPHIFKNGEFFDGIVLLSKTKPVAKKEFVHRFFINKKEINIQASVPKQYEQFSLEYYEDYMEAREKSKTELFYLVPEEVEVKDDFKFDLYFSHHNSYERKINHVFKNQDIEEDKYNGIMLLSKSSELSKREIDFRYLIEKKEYDVVASTLKYYDIVFISYNEPNADESYKTLLKRFPRAKRVHGVKGIHQAHIEAAKLSKTPMFWVVDADATIVDDFNFDLRLHKYDRDIVHIWHSRNPVNDLEYGYGGVKLLPKYLTLSMNTDTVDMTTSISKKIRIMPTVSNYTSFNTDPFSTWKSAFRECVKLASRAIDRDYQAETEARLRTWCTVGSDKPFGSYAIAGAIAGAKYGYNNITDPEALFKINNFEWLLEQYQLSMN
jgi:hypothetical protein